MDGVVSETFQRLPWFLEPSSLHPCRQSSLKSDQLGGTRAAACKKQHEHCVAHEDLTFGSNHCQHLNTEEDVLLWKLLDCLPTTDVNTYIHAATGHKWYFWTTRYCGLDTWNLLLHVGGSRGSAAQSLLQYMDLSAHPP